MASAAAAEGPGELSVNDPGPLPEPDEIAAGAAPAEPKRAGKAAAKPRGKDAAAKELQALIEPAIGMTSYGFAQLVAAPDQPVVDAIAMTAEEAEGVAEPLASILARSSLFARYGRKLLAQGDWLKLAYALAEYGLRVQPLVSQKLGEKAGRRPMDHARTVHETRAATAQREPASSNGSLPYDALSGYYAAE